MLLGLPGGARLPGRRHRHPAHGGRWPASSARARCCASGRRTRTRGARSRWAASRGEVAFEDVHVRLRGGPRRCCSGISFRAEPGTVTALVGPSGSGKSTIIGLIAAFHAPGARARSPWTAWTSPRSASTPTARQLGRGAPGDVPLRRHHPRERRLLAARTPPRRRSCRPAAWRAWTSSRSSSRRATTRSWASAG